MEYTKIKDINEYVSQSVNPMKTPDQIFEMYSVPIYETGHPEYLRGDEIASNKVVVQKNDVLLCKINPRINRVWVVADESENMNIASSEWIVIRNSEYNPEYLAWYFRTPRFQKLMISEVTGIGGSLTRAQPKAVAEYPVPVLKREKQDEIVKVLNKISGVISNRKRELQKLDELIKARFVELFVGKKYEIVKAGSIIKEMRNGVSPSTSGGHFEKVLTLSAITQGKFDDKAWKEGFFTDCPSAEKRITEDDFYICRGNGNKSLVGMGVYALENRPDLVFPDTVIAARIDTERMVLPYLWIMWQQPEVRKQLESGARTTNGTYKINQKVISEIKIICPPINEQEVFADFIKQVNKSKVVVKQAHDKAQLLFDSLMQKYFG